MKDTMTVEELNREIERLRAQWRRIMALLRSGAAGAVRRPGTPGSALTPTMQLDNLDVEIGRLRAQRMRAVVVLRDPRESEKRRSERAVPLARWVRAREVTPAQMRQMRALADEAERWLFAEEVLSADGWRRDEAGHWHGPESPGAMQGPVTDVVVLAQARAEVSRSLEPSQEEAFSSAERVALEDGCDDIEPPPPDDVDESGARASLDTGAGALLDRVFAQHLQSCLDAYLPGGTDDGVADVLMSPYVDMVQARARALVAERVAPVRAVMAAAQSADGEPGDSRT